MGVATFVLYQRYLLVSDQIIAFYSILILVYIGEGRLDSLRLISWCLEIYLGGQMVGCR